MLLPSLDAGSRFDRLTRVARVNPIYYCFDIFKNIILEFILVNLYFYRSSELFLNLLSQSSHIKLILARFKVFSLLEITLTTSEHFLC